MSCSNLFHLSGLFSNRYSRGRWRRLWPRRKNHCIHQFLGLDMDIFFNNALSLIQSTHKRRVPFSFKCEDKSCCTIRLWWFNYISGQHLVDMHLLKLRPLRSSMIRNRVDWFCSIVEKLDPVFWRINSAKAAVPHGLKLYEHSDIAVFIRRVLVRVLDFILPVVRFLVGVILLYCCVGWNLCFRFLEGL